MKETIIPLERLLFMYVGDQQDNPFSGLVSERTPPADRSGHRIKVVASLRLLLVVSIGLTVILVVSSAWQSRRLSQLRDGFDRLDSQQKLDRLEEFSQYGSRGLPAMVNTLNDPDQEVARRAYELIGETQNSWNVLRPTERLQCQAMLVKALRESSMQLTQKRRVWGTSLVQQVIASLMNLNDEESNDLKSQAYQALNSLSGGSKHPSQPIIGEEVSRFPKIFATNATMLGHQAIQVGEPASVAVPLPVQFTGTNRDSDRLRPAGLVRDDPVEVAAPSQPGSDSTAMTPIGDGGLRRVSDSSLVELGPVRSNVATRSAGFDFHLGDDQSSQSEAVAKSFLHQPVAELGLAGASEDSYMAAPSPVMQVSLLTEIEARGGEVDLRAAQESPFQNHDQVRVMQWLGSDHEGFRELAERELQNRGLAEKEILAAREFLVGDLANQLAVVNWVAGSDEVDPKTWATLLFQGSSRELKLEVVNVLKENRGDSLANWLQPLLLEEQDPAVLQSIRRALNH
ncbi:hypothetical protein OAH34_00605 [bacterium]|nr:hypothetical protein [bacterium]